MPKTQERTKTPVIVHPDTFTTLLVHAEPGLASSRRVEAAATLARRLDALLIGVGAATFDATLMADPYMGYATGEWIAQLKDEAAKEITAAETTFARDATGARVEWRTMLDYPHHALVQLARAADLIVMSPRSGAGPRRNADPADVVMGAGRPVLVVPDGGGHLRGEAVVIAWKDTREARRAIADAMPFLRRAGDVIVHAVVKPDAADATAFEVADVVANLKRHGVEARPFVTTAPVDGVTNEIERVAQRNGADLIVCGAYGHSRAREWAFGGVTDDLIHGPKCFVLMSH